MFMTKMLAEIIDRYAADSKPTKSDVRFRKCKIKQFSFWLVCVYVVFFYFEITLVARGGVNIQVF